MSVSVRHVPFETRSQNKALMKEHIMSSFSIYSTILYLFEISSGVGSIEPQVAWLLEKPSYWLTTCNIWNLV
jgi:hypothetical protein